MIWLVLLHVLMDRGGHGTIQAQPMQSVGQDQSSCEKVIASSDELFHCIHIQGAG